MVWITLLLLFAQKPVDGFQPGTYKHMPYRLYVPPSYDKARAYPLVLWLHGAGSVGNDNFKQMSGASLRGTHTWTTPEVQAAHPAFVLAPQAQRDWTVEFQTVLELLNSVEQEFNIDKTRIYIAGQSMGWGDATRANVIAHIPIWAFHGEADPTVPAARSRVMIEAIRKAGGSPLYTEYKGVGHEVWLKAFQEKGLVEWLFAQHK